MLQQASLAPEIEKMNRSWFIIKSFPMTHLYVKQNWAQTLNFKNLGDFIAECVWKEL